MTVETEVATLTTAVDNLTTAVNVSKSTLDASVADALGHAGTASTHKTGAETAKSGAESARDQAYTYSQSAASAVAYQDLTAIAESKSDTAADVFVYDTSKDSDGGQWRKRTQHTSWYNEALNTSTRGSRKEFPSVAVIVAENNKVTIYDGDDPAMPMWMVFDGGNALIYAGVNGVSMLNGLFALGQNTYGVVTYDFLKDVIGRYRHSQVYGGLKLPLSSIANRDTTHSGITQTFPSIVDSQVNDVAMTVLPNAPIDSATGLPIPTIAVATNGGVSVIKDDGSVVDKVPNSPNDEIRRVAFTKNHGLLVFTEYNANGHAGLLNYFPPELLFTTDTIYAGHQTSQNNTARIYAPSTTWGHNNSQLRLNYDSNDYHSGGMVAKDIDDFAIGGEAGVTQILSDESDTYSANFDSKGMVNYITSDYNTGWMNGDIKLAALSDTDDTDVVGSGELVTNGTFDTDVSGWTAGLSSTITYDAGRAKLELLNGAGGVYPKAQCSLGTLTTGNTYIVHIGEYQKTSGNNLRVGISNSDSTGNDLAVSSTINSSTDLSNASFSFTVSGTGVHYLYMYMQDSNGGNSVAHFDNISVRLGDSDRSVNNNGLQVHGTITKDPVATGADLVGYGGFTSSNYLEQPYNSDLDFGTGDFSFTAWFKANSAGGAQYLYKRGANTGGSAGMTIWTAADLQYIALYINGAAIHTPAGIYPLGVWNQLIIARRNGVVTFYINGVSKHSGNNTASVPTGMATQVGYSATSSSLSLSRISATAPTAEQIAKIYEDEKVLFQENAKATLYGTSDAVTALAHDDDTNLLHVGTSSGRSVFQGLKRVDNTTTAVGAAISASNGLVVED
jgi:hypothetical protein